MSLNTVYTAPKTLKLENFVFNPIAVINVCPTTYLIFREEHEIKDEMNKLTNVQEDDPKKGKLVPKQFRLNPKDGNLFDQKSEEKSVIVTKVTTYQLKIISLMDDLVQILGKSPPFDPIDHFKQRKLFADFIVRFSRNYVYEIDRMIEEIQFYQIDHYSYFERSTNHLISKVCNLFAVVMRALQTYRKQLAKMDNENSDKLLHFVELIVCGVNVCIELKIFNEEDLLIKLLLEKSDEFITFLRDVMFDKPQLDPKTTKKCISVTSLPKAIFIPTTNRYVMYESKSKKVKPAKSTMAFPNAKENGKCASYGNQHRRRHGQQPANTMFESQACSGGCSEKSSISPGNVQTTFSDFNFGCSSFNNTCNTDGTLKYINNPVVSQCGNNVSNNKKNTIAANCDTTNMLCRREVSSASSINIDNDHKIMTMLRRTGCLTLPQYQMRILNGYNECGDVNRRSQVLEKKIKFSHNVQHLHVKYGNDDNEPDDDKQTTEELAETVAETDKDFATTINSSTRDAALERVFATTASLIEKTKSDFMAAGNIFITAFVRDFLEAELHF